MSTVRTCRRLRDFGTSIFSEMTELAQRHDAVNLGQGFPDFEGPKAIADAAIDAIRAGHNQYVRSAGVLPLVRAIARHQAARSELEYDAETEITVTCGATEALFSSFQGLLEPGDEVILFAPFYDAYPAGIAAAGAQARIVNLESPTFRIEATALEAAVTSRTRAIVLNTPHNPTGRVFGPDELEIVAKVCREHDLIAIADEVYEHLVFEGTHIALASLDGMRERTIAISSLGKTFSFTGWKVGWALAPTSLTTALRTAHQLASFCTPAPFQLAAARALDLGETYFSDYRSGYRERRDRLVTGLEAIGFAVRPPQGTYFALADIRPLGWSDDMAFCRMLPETVGVAAIPPSSFYPADTATRYLVRFSFAKQLTVLDQALERMQDLPRGTTP